MKNLITQVRGWTYDKTIKLRSTVQPPPTKDINEWYKFIHKSTEK